MVVVCVYKTNRDGKVKTIYEHQLNETVKVSAGHLAHTYVISTNQVDILAARNLFVIGTFPINSTTGYIASLKLNFHHQCNHCTQ